MDNYNKHNEPAILDTPEQILRFRLSALIRALHIETTTGLKVTQIPLLRVARGYGISALNKRTALAELMKLYEAAYGEPWVRAR